VELLLHLPQQILLRLEETNRSPRSSIWPISSSGTAATRAPAAYAAQSTSPVGESVASGVIWWGSSSD
jgi:hypothetical protein